jgi:hypothetical protein
MKSGAGFLIKVGMIIFIIQISRIKNCPGENDNGPYG